MTKRLFALSLIMALLLLAIPALAKDVRITAEIQSIVFKMDKNGNPFARIIVNETRVLDGVEYETGVPVMAFRNTVKAVKKLSAGDTLDAIVATRQYQGRVSYTILALVR